MCTHSVIIAAISIYLLASVGPTVIDWLNVNGLLYVHTPFPILMVSLLAYSIMKVLT